MLTRKLFSHLFVAIMITGSISSTALASPVRVVGLINNVRATESFNPSQNESATISYTVANAAVENVSVNITSSNHSILVATLQNRMNLAQGNYQVSWNGQNAANVAVPSGIYHYEIRYSNARGQMFLSGFIRVINANAGFPLSISVSPAVINPQQAGADTTVINYSVNAQLNGISIQVQNAQGVIIQTLLQSNQRVNAGNYQVTWNGRSVQNNPVAAGQYRIVISSGNVGVSANITVTNNHIFPIQNLRGHCVFPQEFAQCVRPRF